MCGMELLDHMKRKIEVISQMTCTSGASVLGIGFAIPVPDNTEEVVMRFVDQELLALRWNFVRQKITGQEHYILFPL